MVKEDDNWWRYRRRISNDKVQGTKQGEDTIMEIKKVMLNVQNGRKEKTRSVQYQYSRTRKS
jgi:hypothetical protein